MLCILAVRLPSFIKIKPLENMECDVTNYHTRYTLTQLYDEKKKSQDWTFEFKIWSSLMFESNAKLVVNMLSCEFEWCVLN